MIGFGRFALEKFSRLFCPHIHEGWPPSHFEERIEVIILNCEDASFEAGLKALQQVAGLVVQQILAFC